MIGPCVIGPRVIGPRVIGPRVIGPRVWGVVQAPDGAGWDSPGQRPGSWAHPIPTALKGRHGCARHFAVARDRRLHGNKVFKFDRILQDSCKNDSIVSEEIGCGVVLDTQKPALTIRFRTVTGFVFG